MKIYNRSAGEILTNLKDRSVDLILTDPPYDFSEDIKCAYHQEFLRICRGAILVFCPPENQWQNSCDQYLFWIKPISTKNTSKSYSRFVEMIQVWNGTTWNNDRHWSQYTNIFTDLVEDARDHPYAKPLSLLKRIMLNHSNKGDIVLDPFVGIGSTAIVAKQINREFIGSELDPEKYKIALKKLEE